MSKDKFPDVTFTYDPRNPPVGVILPDAPPPEPGPRVTLIEFAAPQPIPGHRTVGYQRTVRPGRDNVFALSHAVLVPPAYLVNGEIVFGDRHYVLASGLVNYYEL